ncbi:MAG: hypothetical protein A3J63_02010 [Candidatus Moranbacteria bacterium RIFCSPHIGHO2_02_FULL_40_12b]|nr:MAG: hypothetical protein A3J63_02010 [Candidatus Moranbacteria bacterium RIFCSPHIGHO2_02_FULL_40_12b]
MIDVELLKPKIAEAGKKHNLKLVVLYGSQARGKAKKGSDIDVAVLGEKPLSFEEVVDLINEFADIFKVREMDVKSLHKTSPFFLYQVVKNGILLYGDEHEYNLFKLYAIRSFQEGKKFRNLRDVLLKKRADHLKKIYVR